MEKPDILFLDEPTNHLDIGTLKWLEQYLKGYKGTMIIVSHDRYFLNETVNRIFEIENAHLSIYEGNYDFYAAERQGPAGSGAAGVGEAAEGDRPSGRDDPPVQAAGHGETGQAGGFP